MKIEIDIPQEIYEMCVKYHQVDYFGTTDHVIRTAIAHGTSLQKTGRWIDDKCSVCGKGIDDLIDSREWYQNENPKYCPFCGIKIEEVGG